MEIFDGIGITEENLSQHP